MNEWIQVQISAKNRILTLHWTPLQRAMRQAKYWPLLMVYLLFFSIAVCPHIVKKWKMKNQINELKAKAILTLYWTPLQREPWRAKYRPSLMASLPLFFVAVAMLGDASPESVHKYVLCIFLLVFAYRNPVLFFVTFI